MATQLTASAASGYMTDAQWDVALGPFRCFFAHYSMPASGTHYVDVGMSTIRLCYVEDADNVTFSFGTNSAGGQTVYFSGITTGVTGRMFVMGN